MATCSFIKESKQTVGAMGRVLRYVSQEKKTVDPDGREYLSGINCGAEVAQQSFMATKNLYSKASGTFFYHYVQSFSPQENVTPAQAHQIALELAERFFPGCEVLVATHVDAEHPHSHFVVNSVHPDTGKKLHFTPRTLEQMRAVSDQLCLEHGLSTLKPYQQNRRTKGLRTGEYRAAVRGESWKFQLITTVEAVMERAGSREEFIREMERRGYRVRWEDARKCITYTTPTGMKCRDDRLHEEKFRKEKMEHDSESGSIQHNSALDMLKQRQRMSAGPPTLIDQQPHVLYTMSPQTVERLEDVLRKTLALQETIRADMEPLATKESLEPLATSQQLSGWLSQTNRLHQRFRLSLQETVSEMKEQQEQDGNRREEFIRQLSEQAKQFRGDGYELMRTFRKWAARTILSSAAAALVISILICRLLT